MLYLLLLIVCVASDVAAQDSEPKVLSGPDFVLSKDAIAAGLEGVFKTSLSIDDEGNVTNVRLYGEPAWPCGTEPKRELEELRTRVESHLRQVKFSPLVKDGKPRKTDVTLEFAIGDAFKRAVTAEEASKGSSPKVIKAGVVNGRAIRLAKPRNVGVSGIAVVQILVDEQGSVSKAGLLMGHPTLSTTAREAACQSKFSPTLIEGKPVQVTGLITYQFRR